jgi:hypothetical protein
LAPGSYTVAFLADGFASQYYLRASTPAAAQAVSVVAGQLTPGVDASLQPPVTPEEPEAGGLLEEEGLPAGLLPGAGSARSSGPSAGPSTLIARASRIEVTRAGVATIKLSCGAGSGCEDSLTLAIPITPAGGHAKHRRSATVAARKLALRALTNDVVRMRLDAQGHRQLARRHGSVRAVLLLRPSVHSATAAAASVYVVRLVREAAHSHAARSRAF